MPTQGDRVRAIVRRRYPLGYPKGALAEVAREVGVSREYARLVVERLGLDRVPVNLVEPLPQACPECGGTFTLSLAQVARAKRNVREGRIRRPDDWEPTCSRRCANKRARRLGREARVGGAAPAGLA